MDNTAGFLFQPSFQPAGGRRGIHQSDKATQSNKAHAQHQQRQDGHTVLAQRRDAFEEHCVGDGAAVTLVDVYMQRIASVVDFDGAVKDVFVYAAVRTAIPVRDNTKGESLVCGAI